MVTVISKNKFQQCFEFVMSFWPDDQLVQTYTAEKDIDNVTAQLIQVLSFTIYIVISPTIWNLATAVWCILLIMVFFRWLRQWAIAQRKALLVETVSLRIRLKRYSMSLLHGR